LSKERGTVPLSGLGVLNKNFFFTDEETPYLCSLKRAALKSAPAQQHLTYHFFSLAGLPHS
jgi:hypothetical protein